MFYASLLDSLPVVAPHMLRETVSPCHGGPLLAVPVNSRGIWHTQCGAAVLRVNSQTDTFEKGLESDYFYSKCHPRGEIELTIWYLYNKNGKSKFH